MFDLEDILFRKGIKQIELARELGISRQAVNQWVLNYAYPRPKTQDKISKAVNRIIERRENAR